MAATIELDYFGASATEPAGASVESPNGFKFNRVDSQAGTTPTPIPTTSATKYSYPKQLGFKVTATAATHINNFQIKAGSAPATGFYLYFKDGTVTYVDSTTLTNPADGATGGPAPTGFTAMTTAMQVWAASPNGDCSTTGRKGNFVQVDFGVDNTYTGGGNSAAAVPDIVTSYDEA